MNDLWMFAERSCKFPEVLFLGLTPRLLPRVAGAGGEGSDAEGEGGGDAGAAGGARGWTHQRRRRRRRTQQQRLERGRSAAAHQSRQPVSRRNQRQVSLHGPRLPYYTLYRWSGVSDWGVQCCGIEGNEEADCCKRSIIDGLVCHLLHPWRVCIPGTSYGFKTNRLFLCS